MQYLDSLLQGRLLLVCDQVCLVYDNHVSKGKLLHRLHGTQVYMQSQAKIMLILSLGQVAISDCGFGLEGHIIYGRIRLVVNHAKAMHPMI